MSPRQQQLAGFVVVRRSSRHSCSCCLPGSATFRAQQFAYVGDLPDRAARAQHPHRLHGPDLARPRRVHGDRRATRPRFSWPGTSSSARTGFLQIGGGMKDVWTIPIAALVAGLVGLAFGIPALRLSGLYLALATFAIAVAMPSVVKRFEEFTGGGSGINLFGTPELTGGITGVTVFGRHLSFNDWLYYLCVGDRARPRRRGVADPARPHRPSLPRRPRQRDGRGLLGRQPRALQDARLRDQRGLRGRRGLALRHRERRSSTRTPSRSRCRSSCSSASSSAASVSSPASSSGRSSSSSCRSGPRVRASPRGSPTRSSSARRSPGRRRSSTESS